MHLTRLGRFRKEGCSREMALSTASCGGSPWSAQHRTEESRRRRGTKLNYLGSREGADAAGRSCSVRALQHAIVSWVPCSPPSPARRGGRGAVRRMIGWRGDGLGPVQLWRTKKNPKWAHQNRSFWRLASSRWSGLIGARASRVSLRWRPNLQSGSSEARFLDERRKNHAGGTEKKSRLWSWLVVAPFVTHQLCYTHLLLCSIFLLTVYTKWLFARKNRVYCIALINDNGTQMIPTVKFNLVCHLL
jgi:hypothetical protein